MMEIHINISYLLIQFLILTRVLLTIVFVKLCLSQIVNCNELSVVLHWLSYAVIHQVTTI